MPADVIFKHMSKRLIRSSIWLLLEVGVGYWLVCHRMDTSLSAAIIAAFCAVLQVALTHAFTLLILAFKIRAERITVVIFILCLAGAFIATQTGWLNQFGISPVNPFAWPNIVCIRLVESRKLAMDALLLLLCASATIPFTFRRVRELHRGGAYRKTPVLIGGRRVILPEEKIPPTPQLQDAIRQIQTHPSLRALDWNQLGFLERVIGLILKPSEKPIAELLLQNEPKWSRNFRGLFWGFMLFAVVGNFVNIQIAQGLARPFSTDPRASIIGLLGLILLEAALFATMFLMIFRLFFWYGGPEQTPLTNGAARRSYRSFRLWPVNNWNVLLIIAKINVVIWLALIPIAILFAYTSPWVRLQEILGLNFPNPPALLVIPWLLSFMAPAHMMLCNPFDGGWRTWLMWFAHLFVHLAFFAVALGLFVSGEWSPAVAVMLAISCAAWFCWAGARYRLGK
jgi:hypothetical protein